MAKAGRFFSSSPPHPSSFFTVFIDTNLDTHLAMVVSPQDTVADLKGKIRTEHAVCFPNIGKVSVEALKIKRRGSFYHLSDSMLVESAFSGIKGTWFLYLDLVPATSKMTCQTESTRVITSETNRQAEKHNVIQANCHASLLLFSAEDRNRDFVVKEMSIGKDINETSTANVRESETLPGTLLPKSFAQDDSLLHNITQIQNLHDSSHEKLVSDEIDRRPDAGVLDMGLVTEGNAVAGSDLHQKSGHIADQHSKEGKGEDLGNVGVGAHMEVPLVASKKEKSRKRSDALQNDIPDGKSEHSYVKKKKRKKEKDQPYEELSKDQLVGQNLEIGVYSKEMSQLEKALPEKSFQKKHDRNLVSSEGFPSKPSNVVSSLQQTPTDAKKKKKKKKYLLKNDDTPQNEPIDNSLRKTNSGVETQSAEENNVEGLGEKYSNMGKKSNAADPIEESTHKVLNVSSAEIDMIDPSSSNLKQSNHSAESLSKSKTTSTHFPTQEVSKDSPKVLTKESNAADMCKQAEQPSNHGEVNPEVPAILRHSRKKSKIEKDASSKHDVCDSLVKSVNDKRIDEASRNNHDRLSRVSGVATTVGNTIFTESVIPTETTVKSSQHSRKKKREKTELPNDSNTNQTGNFSGEQDPEENQNKTSSTHQEHLGKELKGAAVPGDSAVTRNSALLNSTFPSSPSGRKQSHSKRKSEKIELHHQEPNLQCTTREAVKTQITEDISKENSIRHLVHPAKEAVVLGEDVENSTAVQSIVPSTPNDKKSKRNRRKSEKIELPSGQSTHAESVLPSVNKVTKQNPKESLVGNQNEASGSHFGNPGKESEGAAAFGEGAAVVNPGTIDMRVQKNPTGKKSKHSRKKSQKTELSMEETYMNGAIYPLVKEATKENTGETLNGGSTSMGENSKSRTVLREAAGLESTTELDSVITSTVDGRNSCHEEKKNSRTGLINHSSGDYDHDHALASEHTQGKIEKVSGTTTKSSGSEFNARISSDETGQKMDHAKPSKLDSVGFDDSSNKLETGHLSAENVTEENTIGLEKAHKESDKKTVQGTIHKGSSEFRELPKSDSGNIDLFKVFGPKDNQLKPVEELPSMETETKKTNKEKSKRKKKLNPSPQDHNLLKPSVADEQQILKRKPQKNLILLSDAAVQIAKELNSSKKHEKKDSNRKRKLDVCLQDASSDLGSPRRPHDDDIPGKKFQDYESSKHLQALLSVAETKHPNRKNPTSTGSKLQSTSNEGKDIMSSASEVQKHKNFDASISSRSGGALVTQNGPNLDANVPVDEEMADLVASDDSTEDDTPVIRKRYRVAIRKVPQNRYGKVQNKSNKEKTSLAPSATIFNDAISGSSDDEFEISNRHAPVNASSDNSSTSADSDGDLEETQISYKKSSGADSTDYYKGDEGANGGARNNLTQSSNMKGKGKPLNMILRSTSSYKKAKLTASQSEFEDPEDVVPETQPGLDFP